MLLDALDDHDWPTSSQATLARRILPEYLRSGPSHLVSNADVVMRMWQAGDEILPVTYRASPPADHTADVCSPWNHYVRYPIEEIDRHREGKEAVFARALVRLGSVLLRASHIDHVVSVNNWLFATNPAIGLSKEELERMTTGLRCAFPDRSIVIRTVNPALDRDLATRLEANGYRLIASRTVYVLDPSSHAYQRSKNVKEDRRLLERNDYTPVSHDELTAPDMARLAELHRLLYIEKHSALNLQLTPGFFETAWRNRWFEFQALRRSGRIDAYAAWYELNGLVTAALVGYDTRLPVELGLYRRSMALTSEHARRRGLRMHWSAGAGAFKHHRGAVPSVEYDAVFVNHLPRHRRVGWRLLETAGWFQHRKVDRGW